LLAQASHEVESEAARQPSAENPSEHVSAGSEEKSEATAAVDSTGEMPAHIADPSRGPPSLNPEPVPPPPARQAAEGAAADRASSSKKSLIAVLVGVFIAIALAVTLYSLRGPLKEVFIRSPATGTAGPDNQAAGNQLATAAAVAQRAVLYEDDPADAQGKRYVGSVIWRTENGSPTATQASDLAVKAEVEIPERRINVTMSLRRNTDKKLPASHTIDIIFNLPADFPFGGIANAPGIMMKRAEQAPEAPLAGLAVEIISGFFFIGLSAAESEMQRNLEMLKGWTWFTIPVVYNNGRHAQLAIEKGTPGERSFEEAFTAWSQ
jgi:hypothetical protein